MRLHLTTVEDGASPPDKGEAKRDKAFNGGKLTLPPPLAWSPSVQGTPQGHPGWWRHKGGGDKGEAERDEAFNGGKLTFPSPLAWSPSVQGTPQGRPGWWRGDKGEAEENEVLMG